MDAIQNNFENVETTANTIVISWVRENARHFLKSVIDQEAENWGDVNQQTWKIATYNIVKRIRDSTQMGYLINNIRGRLDIYSGNTCLHIENRTEPIPVYSVRRSSLTQPSNVNNWNSNKATIDVTTNKASVDIIRPKHHYQLAEDISPQQSLNTRLLAFKMLVNSQLSDIASSDYWSVLQKHLLESLCDTDEEIFKLSLKIHAKFFTLSYNIMREGFSSLVQGLRSHYSRKFNKLLPVFDQGLDFQNAVHYRIIKISHLILQTAKSVPEHWVRMGEKAVEEIMSIFLALISMHIYDSMNSKNIVYPFHVMATIDPKAKWCRIWLHCGFGRKMFMSQQSRVLTVLRNVIEEILEYLNAKQDGKPTKPVNSVNKESIRLSVFSHCVNILCCISTYRKGHSFFPLLCKVKKEAVTLSEVLCLLIRHLNDNQEFNILNFKVISEAITRVVKTKECPLLSLSEVFLAGLEPMKEVSNQKQFHSFHRVPWHSVTMLEALSRNETGIMFLVEGASSVEHGKKSPWGEINGANRNVNCHPVCVVMNYTNFLLRRRKPAERALIPLLQICSMFFKYYDLCAAVSRIPLVKSAVKYFQYFHSQVKDIFHSKVESKYEKPCKSLIRLLASIVSHPGGLLTVVRHGLVVSELIPFLLDDSFLSWKSPEFRRSVIMLSVLPENEETMVIECTKPLSKVLCKLWTVLEDEESLVRGIERKVNAAVIHYMKVTYTFTCTLSGAKIFLSEYEGSENTLLENGCNPASPAELMMLETCNEPWHKVALLTLLALTRNLDAWLYVESKFGIEKRLVQMQLQNVTSPIFEKVTSEESDSKPNVIIDECSLLRHQILISHVISKTNQEDDLDFSSENFKSFISVHYPQYAPNQTISTTNNFGGKCELQHLIDSSDVKVINTNWIVSARKAFRSSQKIGIIKPSTIVALVKFASQCNANTDTILIWVNEPSCASHDPCAEEMLGIKMSVGYGVHLGLLEKDLPNDHLLKEFIQHAHAVLQIEKNPIIFRGFDWFLSSVFLLCAGNLEDCQTFLNHFVSLHVSLVLWPSLAESKGIQHFCFVFSSLVDTVISASVPLAALALRTSGVPWGTLCYTWLSQCFWPILEWNQVCEWLTLCILYPPDLIVYFCAALLNYIQPKIINASLDEHTWDQIIYENFTGFSIIEQMSFFDKLIKEHRSNILPKLLRATGICS